MFSAILMTMVLSISNTGHHPGEHREQPTHSRQYHEPPTHRYYGEPSFQFRFSNDPYYDYYYPFTPPMYIAPPAPMYPYPRYIEPQLQFKFYLKPQHR